MSNASTTKERPIQHRKVYVEVTIKVSPKGEVRPLTITFEDGIKYEIDRLKQRCRAHATKVGGTGIRCGAIFMRRKRRNHIDWVCANHQRDKDLCPTHYIEEDDLITAFITMVNKLKFGTEDVIKYAIKIMEYAMAIQRKNNQESYECSKEISELNDKMLMIGKLKDKGYLDVVTYQKQSREIMARITQLKEKRFKAFSTVLTDAHAEVLKLQGILKKVEQPLTSFDEELFKAIVKGVEIDKSDMATFELLGGLKFTERCRWKE